ncbi:MAG: T9SS type A sorting domain-containing protein [Bacteroidota bacterium]
MNIQRLIPIFTFLVISFLANAQSLSPTVLSSGGKYTSNSAGSLSYTVGEMSAVSTLTTSTSILTQGFQQADINQGSSILSHETDPQGSIIIYPNPADKTFTIGYKFPESGQVKATLLNASGQIVTPILDELYNTGNAVNNYDCSQVAAGTYTVGLSYTSKDGVTSYTIQKQLIIIKQ